MINKYLKELIEIKTSPNSIALGFAIGTFIAILPTFGLGLFLGFLVILIFPKVSKLALIAALLFWNVFILIPLYSFCYKIGNLLFHNQPYIEYNYHFLTTIINFTRRFLVANLILALFLSILCYLIVYFISKKIIKAKFK